MRTGLGAVAAYVLFTALARAEDTQDIEVRALPRAATETGTAVTAKTASAGAGTQGDAVKIIDTLPGFGRGRPGDFVAWGSSPYESKFYLDGVEVPRLYHGSGIRSIAPTARLSTLTAIPGAFNAEDGGATGGLVQLTTLEPDVTRPRLYAGADFLDATAIASTPVVTGRAAVLAGARYGYADRWLADALDSSAQSLYVIPRYWDVHADTTLALRRGETLRLAGLASSDRSTVSLADPDPLRRQSDDRTTTFGRLYAPYTYTDGEGSEGKVTPFVGWDHDERALQTGAAPARLDVESVVYGVRAQFRTRLGKGVVLTTGADVNGAASSVLRIGSAAVPRREGDPFPFGTPPGPEAAYDAYDVHRVTLSPYVKLRGELGPLTVEPGVRVEGFLLVAERNRPTVGTTPDVAESTLVGYVDPRLSTTLRLSSRASLVLAAGRYHQAPDVRDLGAIHGNPALQPSAATHVAFGERVRLFSRTSFEVLAFSKWMQGIAARSPDPTPAVSRAIVGDGSGRAYGAQFFLRQAEMGGFSGFLSLTVSRSERTDPGGVERLSDYDAPFAAALVAQKTFGPYAIALRGRYATGLPRTPIVGAVFSTGDDAYTPVLGAVNSARLRNFAQVDLRFDRRFDVSDGALRLYLDLQNVTAHDNQEEFVYSFDYRRRGAITGLPALAILGASLEL